ncbi:MAG: NAD-dependent epimerase/dehydratase family protein [Myxococcota bacterium]
MFSQTSPRQILVTGGAGYVGAVLVPKLLAAGHAVRVLDLYLYGEHVLEAVAHQPGFSSVKGDLRDPEVVAQAVAGCDTVIHLACISNDPSFELDPSLGRSINFDAFAPLVAASKAAGVRRFIYASSSSVYGVKADAEVTEALPLEPLTDYSRFKALCEDQLLEARAPGFETVIIRPATVCGYSPRLRLDLIVNIFANQALINRKIRIFGGAQKRPNIHIEDMTDLYLRCVEAAPHQVDGKTFNVGGDNHPIATIAALVKAQLGEDIAIEFTETNDPRSYHISSEKIKTELGFVPHRTIEDAVKDLAAAYQAGKVSDPMTNSIYYNIRTMQERRLT